MSTAALRLNLWPAWNDLWPEAEGLLRLGEGQRQTLLTESGLKHAALHAGACAYASLGFKRWAQARTHGPEEVGVVTTGGPLQLEPAWKFLERAFSLGHDAVNPLAFPHTIVSGVPTSLAAAVQAKAFAFAVGHDVHAFFSALWRARTMLDAGLCRAVLIAAATDANPIIQNVARAAGLAVPLADAAVCGVLEYADAAEGGAWYVTDIRPPSAPDPRPPAAEEAPRPESRYEFDGWELRRSTRPSALAGASALTASGAVACLEAMRWAAERTGRGAGGPRFRLVFEAGGRASGVSMERLPDAQPSPG